MMDIGIVGLGAMGRAIARNPAQVGHHVKAWNRSAGLVDGGMVLALAQVFDGDAVLTILSDEHAIRSVLLAPSVLDRARAGLIHVVASTFLFLSPANWSHCMKLRISGQPSRWESGCRCRGTVH
ncbi:NAD(P)-binding domain-containing protein [Paraburkholderia sp. J41]|uniref:NAD(P)-binding domain-containing protein n=1 Tax=Paraburkholderia sp. J41 TaxID=2805433 RepID=UPI002AC3123D|nr:NAD(P)-binding domain-containing protein [Paraburkholderia sp. J41]